MHFNKNFMILKNYDYFLLVILFSFNFFTNAILILKNKQVQKNVTTFFTALKQNNTNKTNNSIIVLNLQTINDDAFINNQINSNNNAITVFQININKFRQPFLITNESLNSLSLSNKLKKQYIRLFKYKRALLSSTSSSWKNYHPQMRNQMSLQNDGNIYIKERFVEITSVNDPPPSFLPAYRIQCHSCMSAYLEDQFMYISHLYRRPLAFSEKCDHGNFDERYLRTKNCTDPCITLRINDKVGGRKRHGYIRGCLSDIIHYNHTAILASSKLSTKILSSSARSKSISTWTSNFFCTLVRLRDLFLTSNRYNFDSFDHIELCTCVQSLCNNAKRVLTSPIIYLFVLAVITIFWRF